MAQYCIPDAALPTLLDWMIRVDTATVEALVVRLYTNDFTPDRSSSFADFTEATFSGYVEKTLVRSAWNPAAIAGHTGRILLAGTTLEWTPLVGGEVLYGVYVIGAVSLSLYAARRFSVPRLVVAAQPFRVAPVFTLSSLLSA